MSFMIEMRKKKLLKMSDIEEYKTKLEPFKHLEDYKELSNMCQRNIKRVETQTKENKFKK